MQPFYKKFEDGGYIGAPKEVVDGIPTAEECLQIYCHHAKRPYPIPRFEYNVAFAFFRTAVIHQGIASRYLIGTAANPAAAGYNAMLPVSNGRTLAMIEELDKKIKAETKL